VYTFEEELLNSDSEFIQTKPKYGKIYRFRYDNGYWNNRLLQRTLKVTIIRNNFFRNVERDDIIIRYNRSPKVTGNLL